MKQIERRRRRRRRSTTTTTTCHLCERRPTVYCDSDDAFLCSTCDVHVHTANFLAARHVRTPICRRTHHGHQLQEMSIENETHFSTEIYWRNESIVVSNWCRRVLPVHSFGGNVRERVETVARDMIRLGLGKMRNVPWRCVAAAAVWMAVEMMLQHRRRKSKTGPDVLIRCLEECSGVPTKIILLVETKLSRILEEEEGSSECCSSSS